MDKLGETNPRVSGLDSIRRRRYPFLALHTHQRTCDGQGGGWAHFHHVTRAPARRRHVHGTKLIYRVWIFRADLGSDGMGRRARQKRKRAHVILHRTIGRKLGRHAAVERFGREKGRDSTVVCLSFSLRACLSRVEVAYARWIESHHSAGYKLCNPSQAEPRRCCFHLIRLVGSTRTSPRCRRRGKTCGTRLSQDDSRRSADAATPASRHARRVCIGTRQQRR